jgi:hypothetical protein
MEKQALGQSISVPAYPSSTEDLNALLPQVMKYRAGWPTLDAAVFSAISPWGEAVLRNYYPTGGNVSLRLASSSTFRPTNSKEGCKDVLALKNNAGPTLDLIFSYSGVEHDGLGRYGDPVNPHGDIAALREFWLHLRPGGLVLFAVPTQRLLTNEGHNGVHIDHWGDGKLRVMRQRVYGVQRFKKIFTGFTVVGYGKHGQYHRARQD